MTYIIVLKDTKDVSPSPNGYWPTAEGAEIAIRAFEKEAPALRGQLVARQVRHGHGRIRDSKNTDRDESQS